MIIVTGMHRSGTSLVAGFLNEIGLPFGDPASFYRRDEWNEKGYFEQRDIIDINNRLISGFPRTRSAYARILGQFFYLTMPDQGVIEKRANFYRHQMIELGRKYEGLAVKDPRFCLTFHTWNSCVSVDKCVICIREPLEVVSSLKRRQRFPRWIGFRFWNYHIGTLLNNIPVDQSLFVHYNNLAGPNFLNELKRVQQFFELDLGEAGLLKRFTGVFSRDLYHCRQETPLRLPRKTEELWNTLLALHGSS